MSNPSSILSQDPPVKAGDAGGREANGLGEAPFGSPKSWSLRDILRIATSIFSENFSIFLTVGFCAALAAQIPVLPLLFKPLFLIVIFAVVTSIITGHVDGQPTFLSCLGQYPGAYSRVMWTIAAGMVPFLGLVLTTSLPVAATYFLAGEGSPWIIPVVILAALAFFFGLMLLGIMFGFSAVAAIDEGVSGTSALARSLEITSGNFLEILGASLGLNFLFACINLSMVTVASLATLPVLMTASCYGSPGIAVAIEVAARLLGGTACALLGIWQTIAWTLFYYRER